MKMMISVLVLAVILSVHAPLAHAQWSGDPTINTSICAATGTQTSPVIASDGSGGAIITWEDYRDGATDIYVQRVNASGVVQWATNGVGICTATGDQFDPTIISDGSGGAIITWVDERNGSNLDIYVQRINASGAVQWTANGVAICTATANILSHPTIVSDGSGGAIITWVDARNGPSTYDIYAQRINATGAVQWIANGVAICTATNRQADPEIVSDGVEGAIITWIDFRNGSQNDDIYAQRISASGVVGWGENGAAICNAPDSQQDFSIVSDGSGGAIITWRDRRSIFDVFDIYAQRISASGAVQWTGNGVAISTAPGHQVSPTIVSDGSGGAIITWMDARSGASIYDIYAQRINAIGVVQWTGDSLAICTATAHILSFPTIISDGSGGAVITWEDLRNGSGNEDIYAQRINESGVVQWTTNGVATSTATNRQANPYIVSDGVGGAIITWADFRFGSNQDIYAQRVNGNGTLTSIRTTEEIPNGFSVEQNYPNPFNPSTKISWQSPVGSWQTLKIYDVLGNEVAVLVDEYKPAGIYEVNFSANELSSGIYLYKLQAGSFVETKKMILLR